MNTYKHNHASSMRIYTAHYMRMMTRPEIITDHGKPIAVIMPIALWEQFQATIHPPKEPTP